MEQAIALALGNLLSPMVLFFALGVGASLARSDLAIPEAVAKGMALYLMLAIGFKGGASMAASTIDARVVGALLAGVLLSASIPVIAYAILRRVSRLSQIDAAAVAAHYGSISIVTFLAGVQALDGAGLKYEGYMVAVAAAMEAPAILTALWLARRPVAGSKASQGGGLDFASMREIMLNGSIVVLIGSFAIGWITGAEGLKSIAPFIVDPFKGVLCLFLLDMGVIAGRGLREARRGLQASVVLFGLLMPLIGATLGAAAATAVGLSIGGTALMMTLAASASYIAVPAALRLALPEAQPSVYLPLSLGITFPFNLTVGLPIYIAIAQLIR
jgi:hypothetical protein